MYEKNRTIKRKSIIQNNGIDQIFTNDDINTIIVIMINKHNNIIITLKVRTLP